MKFILTSNSTDTVREWSKEFNIKPTKQNLAFIDTAADVYNKAEADWLIEERRALVETGFNVTDYSLVNKNRETLISDLEKFDILFVSGGNTFYLLEHSNKSGFTDLIKEDHFTKKIYVGSSAGSVLLSNNIDPIKHLDDSKKASLKSNDAIGIFNFTIFPHWGSDYFKERYKKATEHSYQYAQPAILLADNQYILFSKSSFELKSVL